MKKEDKLNLAFGKCFAKSKLTEEECDLLLDIRISELIIKHSFNEIQSRHIMLWCQSECQRRLSPAYISKEGYEDDSDVLKNRNYRT